MRTSLDDSTIIKAFVDIQRPVGELDNLEEVTSRHDLETPSEITITEKDQDFKQGRWRHRFQTCRHWLVRVEPSEADRPWNMHDLLS